MSIFILHNQTKTGSYADALFWLLLKLLSEQGFEIREDHEINEIQEAKFDIKKTAFILHTETSKLSFFSTFKLRRAIQKYHFDFLIQVTDTKPFSSRLSLIIISNDIKTSITDQITNSVFFAVCSNVQKQKLAEQNETIANQVKVVPITSDDEYHPITWSEQQSVKMQYTQGREYFFTFSGGKTIQSFTELLKAFSTFKKWQHSSMKLVVAGKLSFTGTEDWQEKINTYKYREDVLLLTDISKGECNRVLAGTYAFIHTPNMENDVLPLLQAMKCEASCITFATDSIEEYTSEAAIMVEPDNYDQLAEKMILLYKDEALRSRLIANGKELSQHYNKAKTFEALTEALSLPVH